MIHRARDRETGFPIRGHGRPAICVAALVVAFAGMTVADLAAQAAEENPRPATVSPTALGLTVGEALGRTFLFDYTDPGAGVEYRMHVTLRADQVRWTELREGGRSETDSAQSVKLDEHRIMMTWLEESGQFVVLYVDFLAGQTTYCGLLRPGIDERGVCYTGTVGAAR